MEKFKIGDRARLIVTCRHQELTNKIIIVLGKGALSYDYKISFVDDVPPEKYGYIDWNCYEWQLEPIIDLGSWDEIQKAINWNLQRRLVIMTRDEWKKYLPLIQSFVEGKELQCIDKNNNQDSWRSVNSPSFDFDSYEYRIKPEPKVIWCNEYIPWGESYECFLTKEDAMVHANDSKQKPSRIAVKYIEAIDD